VAARAVDFIEMPATLRSVVRKERITRILARGASAGALAHLVAARCGVPYAVESFEPHAAYMRESHTWGRWDPRYILQKHWEQAQKRDAAALLPVTEAYRETLEREGVPASRIVTLPCTVDSEQFRFNSAHRKGTRQDLGILPEDVVGIYVGKFGDIYYDHEAFDVFTRFAAGIPGFRMIVLTGMDHSRVTRLADEAGFPRGQLYVATVSHAEVPRFLAAADVAFALVRMAPSRRFCSPVKVGEYLASGLPIVITNGIGDDSDVIRDWSAGAVVDLTAQSVDAALRRTQDLLEESGHRGRIAGLADRFRSRIRVAAAYSEVGLI
jgi:glycosyltransferase involved in cell wall biosynthesis